MIFFVEQDLNLRPTGYKAMVSFASTMCIGNLRSGMESLCAYRQTRNKDTLYKALHYFGVIFLFGLGAGLGTRLPAPLNW